MRWDVRQSITDAGRAWNEDKRGASGRLAWMLDGAGLGRACQFVGFRTDAEWLVSITSSVLNDCGDKGWGLDRALSEVDRVLASEFKIDPDEPSGGPSACLVAAELLQIESDGRAVIDMAVIADSVAMVPAAGGRVRVITDERVKPFEARSLAALASAGPRTSADVPDLVRTHIRRNRTFVNTDSGYAVVSPTRAWRHLVLRETVTVPPGAALVLATDGATRVFDLFRVMSPLQFHAHAAVGRCHELIDTLRACERADPFAENHPRMKIHDDATILVVAPLR
jgi:hypothetical protein